jgi:hypothetical protein
MLILHFSDWMTWEMREERPMAAGVMGGSGAPGQLSVPQWCEGWKLTDPGCTCRVSI